MYIKKMVADLWESATDLDEETLSPGLEKIYTAIRLLNGKTRTTVMLETDQEVPYLGISGGQGGKYLVTGTCADMSNFVLIGPNRATPDEVKVTFCIGAQESEFPLRWCVTLDMALQAARAFAEDGKLDPLLTWENPPEHR